MAKSQKENFRLNYQIEFLAPASIELEDAFLWYEQKKENLGVEFIEELEYYLRLISENPFYFEANQEKENLRKVPLIRFPYIIIHWIDENSKTIFIDAVFHSKRKPKKY